MAKLQASGAFAQALDDNARALNGAYWKIYAAGTTTQATTYSNAALSVANPWPVLGNSAGRLPDTYVAPGNYRIRVETAGGVLVAESDNNVVYGVDPGEVAAAKFKTVAIVIADETMGYALGGNVSVVVATDDIVEAGGHRYSVLASGSADQDITTAGGVKLRVLQAASGLAVEAFGFSASASGAANLASLQAANDRVATTGGVMIVRTPATVQGDFYLSSGVCFDGEGVDLTFNDGAFNISGINANAFVDYWSAKIQITRTGTAGPAIALLGDDTVGANKAPIRSRIYPVIKGSTGVGIQVANGYILDFMWPSVRGCTDEGWRFEYGPTDTTSANLINIFGGETQSCGAGYTTVGTSGLFWHGHGIEGNDSGCTIGENSRDIHHFGAYFERNGLTGYDFTIGDANASPVSISFSGCIFYDGASATKTHAIRLNKVQGFSIRDSRGSGYTTGLVDYQPLSGGVVTGEWSNIEGSPVTTAATNRFFKAASIADQQLAASVTWDVPNLATGASATTTVAVAGSVVGDFVKVQKNGTQSTLILAGEVSANGTVQIRATNAGTSDVDLGSAVFRVIVTPFALYL